MLMKQEDSLSLVNVMRNASIVTSEQKQDETGRHS